MIQQEDLALQTPAVCWFQALSDLGAESHAEELEVGSDAMVDIS